MSFPIRVEEDAEHYYVTIPATQKQRASSIAGRRWLPERKVWAYPRSKYIFETLSKEFKNDAEVFQATAPISTLHEEPTDRPAITFDTLQTLLTKKKSVEEQPEDPAEKDDDPSLYEKSLSATAEDLTSIQNKADTLIAKISELTQSVGEIKGNLISIKDTNSNIETVVEGLEQQPVPESEPTKPEPLDPDNRADLRVIENALISIAQISSKNDPSFILWMSKQEPLIDSFRFISETNEHLKRKLADYLGLHNASRTSFFNLISEASKLRLLTVNDSIHVPQMLRGLNAHRNCFGHPNMNRAEVINRAITYLFTSALIWSEFASDQTE